MWVVKAKTMFPGVSWSDAHFGFALLILRARSGALRQIFPPLHIQHFKQLANKNWKSMFKTMFKITMIFRWRLYLMDLLQNYKMFMSMSCFLFRTEAVCTVSQQFPPE